MSRIAVLSGDGVGPEICSRAVEVLSSVCRDFVFTEGLIGGAAIDAYGCPLPEETIRLCRESDGILLGAVGGPRWDREPSHRRPEKALLGLRKEFELFANLRPIVTHAPLISSSPLRKEIVAEGIDILIIRELNGGIYYGPRERKEDPSGCVATDTEIYTTGEIERIAHTAFRMARKRKGKVTSVDKANVLESSRLWRETLESIAGEYPDVILEHMYVDNCAMQIIQDPSRFDVIVTNNMFGDILSDEASVITGSIGMLPSASIGTGTFGLYEPVHGSAPDIAGKDTANPIAAILSAAMMLRVSFGMMKEARAIEEAVRLVLEKGYRTRDIMSDGCIQVGTEEMGDLIRRNIVAD